MVTTESAATSPPPIPTMAPERHNASWQDGVAPNYDPALDTAHEHRHSHLHHSAAALRNREHETVVYSTGVIPDRSIVPEDKTHEQHVHQKWRATSKDRDADSAEKGGMVNSIETTSSEEKERGRFARFYTRWRIFFHMFIFLFFTG